MCRGLVGGHFVRGRFEHGRFEHRPAAHLLEPPMTQRLIEHVRQVARIVTGGSVTSTPAYKVSPWRLGREADRQVIAT